MRTRTRKFDFTNAEGHTLSGRLELPLGVPKAYAIFAHCFTCSKNVAAATRISRALSAKGIATLRFDFTGLGNSDGDFANTNFSSNTQDLMAAYEALSQEYHAPSILVGHSLGGAAVLSLATKNLPDLKAVVTIGAPSDVRHVVHLFEDNLEEIEHQGQAKVQLAGRSFTIKKQFLEDISEKRLLEDLHKVNKSFLVFHGPDDETVELSHGHRIFETLNHPKSFVALDKTDHLVSKPQDSEYIAECIAHWVRKYIPLGTSKDEVEEGTVVVESIDGFKFAQGVSTTTNEMIMDEPAKLGGDDLGLNPYQTLLASLGGCTAMTVQMYAERKGIPLTKVKVSLTHNKMYFDDCKTCDEKPQKLDHITKHIEIKGTMTPEQEKRIYEIAEMCPVNKTLKSEIVIESSTPLDQGAT